jgi:hypothetical protein
VLDRGIGVGGQADWHDGAPCDIVTAQHPDFGKRAGQPYGRRGFFLDSAIQFKPR